jgi:hypothetical protein
MFSLHTVAWISGREDPGVDRERSHRVALHEAQAATDYHESVAETTRVAAAVRRAALAAAGAGSNVDLGACCA